MYPSEANKSSDTLQAIITSYAYSRDSTIDSLKILVNDDICHLLKIKKPYYLIQWNDSTYGILFKRGIENWYRGGDIEFTYIIRDATHYPDSCSAKQDLQRYLDSRITYKIVK